MISHLIKDNILFEKVDRNGWHVLKCAGCNDYKTRAGFKFENGMTVYNCWNCSAKASHHDNAQKMSHMFRDILRAYNITDEAIDKELAINFFEQTENRPVEAINKKENKCLTPEIELPPQSYLLKDADPDDLWAEVAREYLKLERGLSVSDYPWYLSKDEKYAGRVIIPFFRKGKIIYWQARAMDVNNLERWKNPAADRDSVIFNYDVLEEYSDKHILVMEGVFDAIPFNGICLLGSSLNECAIKALNKTNRKKVFVIDKDKNGYELGTKALKHGWSISFVEGDVNDVNDAITRYGKLWTLSNIIQNIKEGFEAELYLEMILQDYNKKKEEKKKRNNNVRSSDIY